MSKRVTVSLKDFLRVTVAEREKFPTHEAAANELGMTVASFRQRLTRERKRYPGIFESVPSYRVGKTRCATEEQARALLDELRSE